MTNRERQDPQGAEQADGAPRSREGDPRKLDRQDVRTAGTGEDGRAKDDPARAPESGTP